MTAVPLRPLAPNADYHLKLQNVATTTKRHCPVYWILRAVNHDGGGQKKLCAAQAEYVRLAAQAYSPSDAMSQATSWSGS
jgi:hypothetical protein